MSCFNIKKDDNVIFTYLDALECNLLLNILASIFFNEIIY